MATSCFVWLMWALTAAAVTKAAAPSGYNVVSTTKGVAVSTTNVTYRCTLSNEWTESRHPAYYPSNPQLSTPLIVSHTSSYQVWAPGATVNLGFETYVENGPPDDFLFDLATTYEVLDEQVGNNQNVLLLVQQTLPPIRVDRIHSFLTTVTPFNPSPDWFSGFYAFNTIDSASNTFLKAFTIQVFPWNDGTRSGTTYTTTGSELSPFLPISEFTVQTIPPSGVFLNPQRSGVLPVASWTCQLSVPAFSTAKPTAKRPVATPVRRPISSPVRLPAPVKRPAKSRN